MVRITYKKMEGDRFHVDNTFLQHPAGLTIFWNVVQSPGTVQLEKGQKLMSFSMLYVGSIFMAFKLIARNNVLERGYAVIFINLETPTTIIIHIEMLKMTIWV